MKKFEKESDLGVPIHKSLVQPIQIGGTNYSFMVLITTFWLAVAFATHWVVTCVIGYFVMWAIGAYLTKTDPLFLEVFRRHLSYPDYLEP